MQRRTPVALHIHSGSLEEADQIIRPLEAEEMAAVRPRGAILLASQGVLLGMGWWGW